jgi:hypothetical protein
MPRVLSALTAIFALTACFGVPSTALAQAKKKPTLKLTGQSYVEIADSEKLIDLNGTWTVEMWVKFDENNQYFVGDESWPLGDGTVGAKNVKRPCGWVLRMCDDRKLDLTLAQSKKTWLRTQGEVLKPDDAFHHIAVSKDDKVAKVFYDGKQYAQVDLSKEALMNCPSNLFLGVRSNPLKDREVGCAYRAFRVSDKKLYTKAFKPPAQFEKTDDTLVLYDFSAGEGDKVPDLSGKKHDGDISGGKWQKE